MDLYGARTLGNRPPVASGDAAGEMQAPGAPLHRPRPGASAPCHCRPNDAVGAWRRFQRRPVTPGVGKSSWRHRSDNMNYNASLAAILPILDRLGHRHAGAAGGFVRPVLAAAQAAQRDAQPDRYRAWRRLTPISAWTPGAAVPAFNGAILVDAFAQVLQSNLLVTAALAVLLAITYLENKRLHLGEYYALVLFSTAGSMLMAATNDLIVLFVAMETLSVALYVLAGFARTEERSEEAALKYFLLGAFAAGFCSMESL